MDTSTLTPLAGGGSFYEGPRWHEGRWWVSDFYRHGVFTVTPDGEQERVLAVPGRPSGLGWMPDGSLLVVSMTDHVVLRTTGGGGTAVHARIEGARGPANDMVVAATGHAYVGTFGFDLMNGEEPVPSPIYGIAPDGTVTVAADGLHFPNGTVITPDGATLIVGETLGRRYTAFTIAADGSLTDRRTWGEMDPHRRDPATDDPAAAVAPDGCALDADGHIWAADALGGRVVRLAPGGAIVDEVAAPDGSGAYACALGGDDGRTLLVCLAPDYFEHARKDTREASLATVTVDVPHAGLP